MNYDHKEWCEQAYHLVSVELTGISHHFGCVKLVVVFSKVLTKSKFYLNIYCAYFDISSLLLVLML